MMYTLFRGFGISLLYWLVGGGVLYLSDGPQEAWKFMVAFIGSFNTLVTLGLILGTALIVFRSQDIIPNIVENAFTYEEREATRYRYHKKRFRSIKLTALFSAQFVLAAYGVFHLCRFPLRGRAETLMLIAVCAEWGLGVYVGRKLAYSGMMLHSLLEAPISKNLFRDRELDGINAYVNITSTLTVIFVYIHVRSYYTGPLKCDSPLGESAKIFLFLPALIAIPVLLIFNFYPRAVLRKVYSKSIDLELEALQATLQSEQLSAYEKRSCLLAFDKMYRDELRHNLQLTLNDLPIVITISVMVLERLIRR